jgi:hypothetical protein
LKPMAFAWQACPFIAVVLLSLSLSGCGKSDGGQITGFDGKLIVRPEVKLLRYEAKVNVKTGKEQTPRFLMTAGDKVATKFEQGLQAGCTSMSYGGDGTAVFGIWIDLNGTLKPLMKDEEFQKKKAELEAGMKVLGALPAKFTEQRPARLLEYTNFEGKRVTYDFFLKDQF